MRRIGQHKKDLLWAIIRTIGKKGVVKKTVPFFFKDNSCNYYNFCYNRIMGKIKKGENNRWRKVFLLQYR